MTHRMSFSAGFALLALMALTAGRAEAQEGGTAQKVGEKIDQAVEDIKEGASQAGDAIRERVAKARASVRAMGVEARVYGRLHWDKSLEGVEIEVSVQKDGTALLSGTLPTHTARAKAIELAKDTVGVTKVIDRMTSPKSTSATTGDLPK